jgi:hypothetical protein
MLNVHFRPLLQALEVDKMIVELGNAVETTAAAAAAAGGGHDTHALLLQSAECLARPLGVVEPCQRRLAAVVVTRWLVPLPTCAVHLHDANPAVVAAWLGPSMSVDSARAAAVVIALLRDQVDKNAFAPVVASAAAALDSWSVTSAAVGEADHRVQPLALCCAVAQFLLQHREILSGLRASAELRRVCVASVCYHVRGDGDGRSDESLSDSLDGLGKLLRLMWSELGGNLPPELHQMYVCFFALLRARMLASPCSFTVDLTYV